MCSVSGTSMERKKMVPLIECSTYPILRKTDQLRIKKRESEKRNKKISFTSLSLYYSNYKVHLKVSTKIVFN